MISGSRWGSQPAWAGLAALLCVAGLIELVVWLAPAPARVLVAVAATVPVALAGRRPMTALLLVHGTLAVDAAVRRTDEFVVAALLAMMATVYAVAASRPVHRAVPGLAVALLLAELGILLDPDSVAGDHVFAAILLTVPWLAGVAVRHWRDQALELERVGEELREAQEARVQLGVTTERMRMARDLHDSTAQALNAVIVHAEAAEEALTRDPDEVVTALRRIQQVGRSALADTRQVVEALRGDGTGNDPRLVHLEQLVETFSQTGMHVVWSIDPPPEPLPAAVEAAAFRIVQEGLTNVLKHSQARSAEVVIGHDGGALITSVHDPGPPRRSPGGAAPGHGLVGMRERAALVGGTLQVDSRSGFTVRARLPVGAQR